MTTDQISPTDTGVYLHRKLPIIGKKTYSCQSKESLEKKVSLFDFTYYFPIAHLCQITTVFYAI